MNRTTPSEALPKAPPPRAASCGRHRRRRTEDGREDTDARTFGATAFGVIAAATRRAGAQQDAQRCAGWSATRPAAGRTPRRGCSPPRPSRGSAGQWWWRTVRAPPPSSPRSTSRRPRPTGRPSCPWTWARWSTTRRSTGACPTTRHGTSARSWPSAASTSCWWRTPTCRRAPCGNCGTGQGASGHIGLRLAGRRLAAPPRDRGVPATRRHRGAARPLPGRRASGGRPRRRHGAGDGAGLRDRRRAVARREARPLAATAARRIPSLPDLPTMAEAGFPENETYSWLGVVAPAATPDAAVARLNGALAAATRQGRGAPAPGRAWRRADRRAARASPRTGRTGGGGQGAVDPRARPVAGFLSGRCDRPPREEKPMDTHRRAVLAAGLAATTTERFRHANARMPRRRRWTASSASTRRRGPRPPTTSGTSCTKHPEGVLLPGSDDDVAATIRWAARRGRKFAPQGQRHSVFGRSMARDGIVATCRGSGPSGASRATGSSSTPGRRGARCSPRRCRRGSPRPCSPTTSSCRSAAPWSSAASAARPRGSACRATTSSRWTWSPATGRKVTCSASSNADLFDAVRAGLGQVGVDHPGDAEARSRRREQVRRFLLFYPDLATMLKDAAPAGRRRPVRRGAGRDPAPRRPVGWTFRLDAAKYFTGTPPDDDALLAGLSDDPAKRQPSTLTYFDYLNRLAAAGGGAAGQRAVVLPAPVAHHLHR